MYRFLLFLMKDNIITCQCTIVWWGSCNHENQFSLLSMCASENLPFKCNAHCQKRKVLLAVLHNIKRQVTIMIIFVTHSYHIVQTKPQKKENKRNSQFNILFFIQRTPAYAIYDVFSLQEMLFLSNANRYMGISQSKVNINLDLEVITPFNDFLIFQVWWVIWNWLGCLLRLEKQGCLSKVPYQ